jgi:toxin YoeB
LNLTFSPQAWEDYTFWQSTDSKTIKRIRELLNDIVRNPDSGIGKPETLKYAFGGHWSRRIDFEHRIIYKAVEGSILIAQLRFHYEA